MLAYDICKPTKSSWLQVSHSHLAPGCFDANNGVVSGPETSKKSQLRLVACMCAVLTASKLNCTQAKAQSSELAADSSPRFSSSDWNDLIERGHNQIQRYSASKSESQVHDNQLCLTTTTTTTTLSTAAIRLSRRLFTCSYYHTAAADDTCALVVYLLLLVSFKVRLALSNLFQSFRASD